MVVVTFCYLIAVSDNLAVLVKEGSLHVEVVEPAENILNVVLLACLDVGITEFIVAPAYC